MKKLALHWQVLIAMALGVLLAFLSITYGWNEWVLNYVKPFGDIFINILKLIAVPLVLFSVISGIASLQNVKSLGKIGIKTLLLYLVTTILSVSVGLIIVNLWQPGKQVGEGLRKERRGVYESFLANKGESPSDDLCVLCEDSTLAQRVAESTSKYENKDLSERIVKAKEDNAKQGPLAPLIDIFPDNIFVSLADKKMLQIIFFAVFMGLVMLSLPEKTVKPVQDIVEGFNAIFVRMVELVMVTMPFFVFALMAGALVESAGQSSENFIDLLQFLMHYGLAVLLGLGTMIFVTYPSAVKLLRQISFKDFLKSISKAQLTAFSTSSSVATLPVTMQCVHDNLKVSKNTTSFVLPIGATVNMDGTSLYQAVAVVALSQLHMVDLSITQQLVIVSTATLASIGAAAIPSAGLVLMILVLESVGLDPTWIALIFPVDRILDMCRTVVNVTGDATVSLVVDKDVEG